MVLIPSARVVDITVFMLLVFITSLTHGKSVSIGSNDLASRGTSRKVSRQGRLPLKTTVRSSSGLHKSEAVKSPSGEVSSKDASSQNFPLKGGSTLLVLPFLRKSLSKDWCKARQFLQKIHHPGCNSTYITNSMCVGQCLSMFIPNHFVSCAYCTPVVKNVISVKLTCHGRSEPLVKKVSIIKTCKCMPCGQKYS